MALKCSTRASSVLLICLVVLASTLETFSAVLSSRVNSVHTSKRSAMSKKSQCFIEFRCKNPQSRSYHLSDLLHEAGELPVSENPEIEPAYLLVSRCDGHSGCCPSAKSTCQPVEGTIEYPEVDIFVRDISSSGRTKKTIKVEQHRECYCGEANATYRRHLERRIPNVTFVKS